MAIDSAYKASDSFFTSHHHAGLPSSRKPFPPGFGPNSQQTLATFGLPNQLPSKPINGLHAPHYTSLVGFQPDDELVEMMGSKAGALNMHLKRIFGHVARSTGDGILPIIERGPPICATQYTE